MMNVEVFEIGEKLLNSPFCILHSIFNMSKADEIVKSRKCPLPVIPAPHQVRDKLQPDT